MIDKIKEIFAQKFTSRSDEKISNAKVQGRQKMILKSGVVVIVIIVLGLVIYLQENRAKSSRLKVGKEVSNKTKLELPDSTIDTERRWRDHFEKMMDQHKLDLDNKIAEMQENQSQFAISNNEAMLEELYETKEKLKMAQEELINASLDLKRVSKEEEDRINAAPAHEESAFGTINMENEVEYGRQKSAENYIPEGTYFTGYLLGGMVVSTALSTADENATPVVIKLTNRGNLSKYNKTDIKNCKITGSAYGDLSSERAIIRLEKLVCEQDGLYQTSKISGQIFGPDGYNGIKGTVVSTSSKHMKNIVLGGLISGLSGSSKGEDAVILSGGGGVLTKKKGIKDVLVGGMIDGAGNAGEKLAEYYLKQAEAMSPVLTVPGGVRVNPQITNGFFLGEIGTHKKIKKGKK